MGFFQEEHAQEDFFSINNEGRAEVALPFFIMVDLGSGLPGLVG